MSAFINFKICDNADECSGIAVCPTNAFSWDVENKTVVINNENCICCRACEDACPAGAIRVAITKEEEQQIKEDFDNDPRSLKDLLVERYGASPIDENIIIPVEEVTHLINSSSNLVVIEATTCDDAPCLINSVPISDIFGNEAYDYHKVLDDDNMFEELIDKYDISVLPTLLIFYKGKIVARHNGPVENTDIIARNEFILAIKNAIGQI